MLHKRPTVSVIFPTLNEAKNLPLVFPYLPLDEIDEVLLVDGRSTDDTIEVARRLLPFIKVVLETAPGKGAALRAGYRAASGDIVICMDADGSHDPREIPRFIHALLEGADFVKGSRFAPRGGTTDMPRFRKLGNGAFVLLVNLLFDGTFTDITYGYHAFWRHCLDLINQVEVDGFEFEIAMYVRCLCARLRIIEVPSFEGYRFTGLGKLQTIPDGWRILKTIFREWVVSLRAPCRDVYIGFQGNMPSGAWAPASAQPSVVSALPAAERARATLQLLYAVSRALAAELNLRDLLQRILQLTLESVGAASGSIVVLDEKGDVIEGCVVYEREVRPLWATGLADTVKQGLAGWVVEHREAALVPSTREDPRWLRRSWDEDAGMSRSALGIPLVDNGRVVGVLTLVRPQSRQFTEDDLALVASLAVCA